MLLLEYGNKKKILENDAESFVEYKTKQQESLKWLPC